MRNCIHFDESAGDANRRCLRCETGYRINRTSNICIECNSEGKVGDYTDKYCYFFALNTLPTDNYGRCENLYETD